MGRSAVYSAILHVVVFVIAWFGVPQLFRPEIAPEQPFVIEVLPIAAVTNVPPKPEPPKPDPPKPEPPKPEPPKPPLDDVLVTCALHCRRTPRASRRMTARSD